MTLEELSQWKHDAVVMREFRRSPEWETLKKHLDLAVESALARMDSCAPSDPESIIHWRAVRKGFVDARDLPESIIRQSEAIDAQHKMEQSRLKQRKV